MTASPLSARLAETAGSAAIPATFFGLHVVRLPATTIYGDYDSAATASYKQTPWPAIGAQTYRTMEADGCTARNIMRSPDVFVWDRFDFTIRAAKAGGVKQVIVQLGGMLPDWMTTPPGEIPATYVGHNANPPASDAAWTSWCTAATQRMVALGYPGALYEVWNEASDTGAPTGYTGTVAQLVHVAQLAQLAHAAIKAIDPSATVLTPSFFELTGLYSGSVSLDSYLAAGGAAYADAIALHGYNTGAPLGRPESLIAYTRMARGIMAAHGVDLPMHLTEWGYGLWIDQTGAWRSQSLPPDPMSPVLGAAYVTRMALVALALGYASYCFFAADGFNYTAIQMLDPAAPGTVLMPGQAFSYLTKLFTIGSRIGSLRKNVVGGINYWWAPFDLSNNRNGIVYWTETGTVNINNSKIVSSTDNLGNTVPFGSVGTSPIFGFYN